MGRAHQSDALDGLELHMRFLPLERRKAIGLEMPIRSAALRLAVAQEVRREQRRERLIERADDAA